MEKEKIINKAVLTVGPRGGKRYLSVEYIQDGIPHHHGIGGEFRDDMENMIAMVHSQGVKIEIESI